MRLIVALLLALLAVPVAAEERIRDFGSDIRIARDGTLTVAETITIASEGDVFKRGIFRDFPTSYDNKYGQRTRVTFDVVSVTRDGKPEPYELEGLSNGTRVKIGQADVFLENGDHRYVITYRTTRQLLFLDGYDEIYWNVTGNGWRVPIDFASVRIALPSPAKFGQRTSYTGPQGATGTMAQVWDERPGFIAFRTTARLAPNEGLTVGAAFPKGVVDAPSEGTRTWWWLQDWAPLAAGLVAALGLLAYQLRAWWIAGRGPRAGTVVPIFAPPDGLSAAATRYISRMGMDNRAFTAAIVESGVKGQLHIDKRDGGWFASDTTTLARTGGGEPLAEGERRMLDTMLSGTGDTVELKQENHSVLQAARKALGDQFDTDYLGKLYRKNTDWAVWGLLGVPVAVFAVAIVAALVGAAPPGEGFTVPLVGLVAILGCYIAWRFTVGEKGCMLVLGWAVAIGCAIAVFFAAFGCLVLAIEFGSWPVAIPLATLPVALFAFKWMEAPTAEGRAVMDRIAGFKHYLGITEEARLDTLHPPEKTPALFEKYLPYAIALDVENRWADKFAGVLAAAAATGATASHMAWYSGQGNIWDDPGGFASSVGSSLNSAVSSAATSPSSSGGGSGGGGSSGGGGGGGGGGGW